MEKDVFDRLLEFLGNKRLEQNGLPGHFRSVHICAEDAPQGEAHPGMNKDGLFASATENSS